MTTQITERDKKLLVGLVAFLVVVGFGWLLIRPAIARMGALDTQIATAQAQQHQTEYNIGRIPEFEQKLQDNVDALTAAGEDLYPMMESQEVDSLLTLLALRNGFTNSDLRELDITAPTQQLTFSAYLAQTDEAGDPLDGVYASDVNFTLFGARDQLESFLDIIANEYGAIHIASYTWSQDRTSSDNYTLKLHLLILMTDSQSISDDVANMLAEQSALAEGELTDETP